MNNLFNIYLICVNFSNALPKVVFYGMSTTYGSEDSYLIGRGHLIFNGMWGLDLGNSPNYHTEEFLGKLDASSYFCSSGFRASKHSLGEYKQLII